MMADFLPAEVDVLIVGAGPVGLCAANLLGTFGIDAYVIERRSAASTLPRAIMVDDETLRTLQACGLDRQFQAMIRRGRGARYYDENGKPFAEVGAGPMNYGFPKRSHFFQPDLEGVLRDGLRRFNRKILWNHELVALRTYTAEEASVAGATVTVRRDGSGTRVIRAAYVLACDGARSGVRDMIGAKMEGESYSEDWVIFDCATDPDTEPISKFHCRTDRPFVSVVGPKQGRRYELRAMPGDTAESLRDPRRVRALLQSIRRGPVNESDVTRAAVYRFEAKLASSWQRGRVFLLGDAAHLTPPFAGQGMNSGIRDANNVSWKVALAINRRSSSASCLLASYEVERREPAWRMVQLAVAMGELVMPESAMAVDFRSRIIALMDRFPNARDYVVGMKFKPPPSYTRGAFVFGDDASDSGGRRASFHGSLVGHMLPQPPVRWRDTPREAGHVDSEAAGTQSEPRLDTVFGAGWALLAQCARVATAATAAREALWPELAPTLVLLDGSRSSGGDEDDVVVRALCPEWEDPHTALPMAAIRAHRDQILLIRPDRFVAAACWPDDARSVRATVAALRAKLGYGGGTAAARL